MHAHTQIYTHSYIKTYNHSHIIYISIFVILIKNKNSNNINNIFLFSLQPVKMQYYRRGLQFSCISTEIKPLTHETAVAGRE